MSALSGKTALVHAQAGCGIGDACTLALQTAGAGVFATHQLSDVDEYDLLSDAGWQALVQRCLEELGRLDIFVCCAPRNPATAITGTSLAQFQDILYDSALKGWLGQKHAVLAMREHGRGGGIVHVTSVLARAAVENAAAQSAAEAGLLMSAKAAALECAKRGDGILVNTVLAGPIEEDGASNLLPEHAAVSASSVADAALFLLSDGADYMTGTEIAVDRGFLSR